MIDVIRRMLPAAIGDTLTAHGFPAAGVATYILDSLIQNRITSASNIWCDIVKNDWSYPLTDDQKEELVSIIDTFLRYAREGAAQENLKLLAQIIAGQKAAKALRANEFLHYANLLAPLTYEEICLLGTLAKHDAFKKQDFREIAATAKAVMNEMIPSVFKSKEEFEAVSQALTRTGFVCRTVASNDDCNEPPYLTPMFEKIKNIIIFDFK